MNQTNLFGYKVNYINQKEFKLLKDDIFIYQNYHFDLKIKNPVIFDLGSHIGLTIIYFKSIFPDATIYGFEPNPNVFQILKENLDINGFKDVYVFNIALSDTEGVSELYVDSTGDEWNSNSSLIKGGWTKKENLTPIEVQTERLSKYLNDTVDILKIDIEGSEFKILKEIESKLDLIQNLAIEYHPNTPFKPLVNLLFNNEFKVRYIQNGKDVLSPNINELLIIKASK